MHLVGVPAPLSRVAMEGSAPFLRNRGGVWASVAVDTGISGNVEMGVQNEMVRVDLRR